MIVVVTKQLWRVCYVIYFFFHTLILFVFHCRVASAWGDLLSLVIHFPRADQQDMFREIVTYINSSFFPMVVTSPTESPLTAPSLQKIFYGFRVMIEILVTLKVESLRSNPSPRLENLLALYWTHTPAFLRQLLYHCRSKF